MAFAWLVVGVLAAVAYAPLALLGAEWWTLGLVLVVWVVALVNLVRTPPGR